MFEFCTFCDHANISAQMIDLKEQIEHEVQSAREEYMKMESHIKLYITEMEQSI